LGIGGNLSLGRLFLLGVWTLPGEAEGVLHNGDVFNKEAEGFIDPHSIPTCYSGFLTSTLTKKKPYLRLLGRKPLLATFGLQHKPGLFGPLNYWTWIGSAGQTVDRELRILGLLKHNFWRIIPWAISLGYVTT